MSRHSMSVLAVALGFAAAGAATDKTQLQAAFDRSKESKKPLLVVISQHG